jgi:hypothetical protein
MTERKNSRQSNLRKTEEEARRRVRGILATLPRSVDDAIAQERALEQKLAQKLGELVSITDDGERRLDAMLEHNHDGGGPAMLRILCADWLEQSMPPSSRRNYILSVLRKPDPPSKEAVLRNGISWRNHLIYMACRMAVRLGLSPTRNRAQRYNGGVHSACSLVADELAKCGARRSEDAIEKVWRGVERAMAPRRLASEK